jgi:DNA topoisomerase-1
LDAAKNFITEKYGKNYWAGKVVKYVTKSKGAQEAHEAIRPAYANKTPESLAGIDARQLKLYTLIWQRFISCQMAPAVFDSVSADIKAHPKDPSQTSDYTFRANGQTLKFEGFLKVYPVKSRKAGISPETKLFNGVNPSKFEEKDLPNLEGPENGHPDKLDFVKLDSIQHFTEPPARYNEASLIKTLEKNGVGRPSTYAPTLSTIQDRNYVSKNEQKRFIPSEMGIIVNDVLVENFPEIVDIGFTAKMEEELDNIAEGKDKWEKICKDFYNPFAKILEKKYKDVEKTDLTQETDKICPKCGSPIIERMGRFGRFYACSKFPECKHTESIENKKNDLGIKCPKCKEGDIVARKTKRGKIFYGCNKFPKCDFALWDKPINEFCPMCDSILVQKNKNTIKCSNKDCDYTK